MEYRPINNILSTGLYSYKNSKNLKPLSSTNDDRDIVKNQFKIINILVSIMNVPQNYYFQIILCSSPCKVY